jgi:hypothetical protein
MRACLDFLGKINLIKLQEPRNWMKLRSSKHLELHLSAAWKAVQLVRWLFIPKVGRMLSSASTEIVYFKIVALKPLDYCRSLYELDITLQFL